ncbi:hypothetical protein C1645_824743 [Glomus cerebriforme]|uniref:Uncharacterized protein n=1 Tax=Glomus cerebriforme TaxID=658196 RepID=A0A397T367_9GLOM|nr:hypothetical protein C1645_824743 [Glomus cerebriforme]
MSNNNGNNINFSEVGEVEIVNIGREGISYSELKMLQILLAIPLIVKLAVPSVKNLEHANFNYAANPVNQQDIITISEEYMKLNKTSCYSQWHLKEIGNNEVWHHLFCDLTIKKPDNPYPEVILEIIATGSVSTFIKHFDRVIKYADQLCPEKVFAVP